MLKGIEVESNCLVESLEFRETFQLPSGVEPSTTDAVETTTPPGQRIRASLVFVIALSTETFVLPSFSLLRMGVKKGKDEIGNDIFANEI